MTRGLIADTAGRALFAVIEDTLFKIGPTGVRTAVGTLLSSRNTVGMKMGLTQLVIVDGLHGYVYDLLTGTFSNIVSDGWLGSYTVDQIDGYFVFIDPNSQTFYISALEDALTIEALDFATANGSPDKLVGQAVSGRTLYLMGETSMEIWRDSGAADFPFERSPGAFIEAGLMAAHTAKVLDNSVFWLGRDVNGAGQVYKLNGYAAVRISTAAIEQLIQAAVFAGQDVTKATAYAYQMDGHAFYCLNVPGLDTTWVYDVATGQWHERAEFVLGDYAQHRGKYHAYCYGKHMIAGDDNVLYAYDVDANTNAGDVLVRDRISPHMASPSLDRLTFPLFELDCEVGWGIAGQEEALQMLRYSNDGGHSWGNWRTATLGAVGEKRARPRFLRCGSARDRVWHSRCTADVKYALMAANIEVV